MAKMGSRKHLKRYKAPKTWPIHPKEDTWTVKPSQEKLKGLLTQVMF